MDNLKNISGIADCYGCGVCAVSCPIKIIIISLNKDGFYSPSIIEKNRCIACGACVDACSYIHNELSATNPVLNSYAAWSKDDTVRYKCSSGGVGFELGRVLLQEGYKVCGVRYNVDKEIAEHYISETEIELEQSIGSKYIQSYTVDGFRAINKKEKYLVTGTPCQIDSFRRYIQRFKVEENFLLLDFFCHGVPSMLMWRKYLDNVKKKFGKFSHVSWRNKITGWHDSWAMHFSNGSNNYNMRYSEGDFFYLLFLSNSCLGKACYDKCKFKYNSSAADIRIGDLWGKEFSSNDAGVSAAIAFTIKGDEALNKCNCVLQNVPFDIAAEGQMKTAAKRNKLYNKIHTLLVDSSSPISKCAKLIIRQQRIQNVSYKIKHPGKTITSILKRLLSN